MIAVDGTKSCSILWERFVFGSCDLHSHGFWYILAGLLLEIWEEWDALPTTVWIRRDPLSFFGNDGLENGIFFFHIDVFFWLSISNFSKNSPKKSIQQKSPPKNIHNKHFQQNSTNISPKLNTHPSPQKNITRPGVFVYRGKVQMPASGEVGNSWRWQGDEAMKLTQPMATLPETDSSPLKIDPWKRRFLSETTIFRGYVSLRECNPSNFCGIKMRLVWLVIKPNLLPSRQRSHIISYPFLSRHFWVDDVPISEVGYVSSWEGNLHLWSELTEWVNDYLPAVHGGNFSHFLFGGMGIPMRNMK